MQRRNAGRALKRWRHSRTLQGPKTGTPLSEDEFTPDSAQGLSYYAHGNPVICELLRGTVRKCNASSANRRCLMRTTRNDQAHSVRASSHGRQDIVTMTASPDLAIAQLLYCLSQTCIPVPAPAGHEPVSVARFRPPTPAIPAARTWIGPG